MSPAGAPQIDIDPAPALVYTPTQPPPVGIGGPSMKVLTMKSGIHPDYHEINVIMTDGTEYKTRSCYAQPGATLRLDIDPKSHPAWTGVQRLLDTGGQVAKFNKKFGGLGRRTKA
jgi:large subunit ribosomal protein L31